MSNKATCPGCGSHTSAVYDAMHGERAACDHCGLPGSVIYEVHEARKREADKELLAKYEAAIVRAGKAEAERDRLGRKLERFMAVANDEDWIPDKWDST